MTAKRLPKSERRVAKGQIYSTRPKTKGAQLKLVRIISVTYSQQPKATYRQITKSGNEKGEPIRCWLSWTGRQWSMPPTWKEEIND